MESKQDANVLRMANEKEYCPMCPNKLGVKISHTVSLAVQFQRVVPSYEISGFCLNSCFYIMASRAICVNHVNLGRNTFNIRRWCRSSCMGVESLSEL